MSSCRNCLGQRSHECHCYGPSTSMGQWGRLFGALAYLQHHYSSVRAMFTGAFSLQTTGAGTAGHPATHLVYLPGVTLGSRLVSAPGPIDLAGPRLRRCLLGPQAQEVPARCQAASQKYPAHRTCTEAASTWDHILYNQQERDLQRRLRDAELSEVSKSVGTSPPPP